MKREEPNYTALIEYLDSKGIDASRVQVDGLDETGYDYVAQFPDGRPVYRDGFQLTYDRKHWPSGAVYENVMMLYAGGNPSELKPEESVEEDQPKDADEPADAPTVEEKQAAPAEAKKPTPRKKTSK